MEKQIKRICKIGHHKALLTEPELPRRLSGKESVCQCGRPGVSVQSLDQEDLLKEEMATDSSTSILA